MKKTLEERFWEKVDKEKSSIFYDGTRCWEWTAYCEYGGYGTFRIDGETYKAHRISYQLTHGKIPYKLMVLHRCDNPSCVNPNHLFLGTQLDNMQDMVKKNRQSINEKEHVRNRKLTPIQIKEIRKRYAWLGVGGESSVTLAKAFGVSQVLISQIVNYKHWKNIE